MNQEKEEVPVNGTSMSLAGLVTALLVFVPAQIASADDYLNEVVDGLQETSVFVDPGFPGTDADTASELENKLQDGDGIVLVMVPSEAQVSDPQAFIQNLGEQLGGDDIIGLAIGDDTYAYSTIMPKGVASDLMDRAESVSTGSQETLVTFTRNVHAYEAAHPAAVDVPKQDDGSNTGVWVGGGVAVLLALAAAGVVMWWRRRSSFNEDDDRITIKRSPDNVKMYLEQLASLRMRVQDPGLQRTLQVIVRDTEAYFDRYTNDRVGDGRKFGRSLERLVKVVTKYVDVEKNGYYYENAPRELEKGKASTESFADYVLRSCKNGSTAQLAEFDINTDILNAEKHRS